MGKDTELSPEQKEGLKQYEKERQEIISRVLAKDNERKQAEILLRASKKRGVKK